MAALRRILTFVLIGASCFNMKAQVDQSPYSINGIGDVRSLANPSHFGMAEIGLSTPTPFHINNMNPALLTYNKLTSYNMGVAFDNRSISTETLTQKSGGALLNNLVFSFPVMQDKWTMSFGLMPYSNINYNVTVKSTVEGTPIPSTSVFEGEGGLVHAYFANGFVLAKGLSVGLRGSYIFGSIDDVATTIAGTQLSDNEFIEDADTVFNTRYKASVTRQTIYGDVTIGTGLHYRYQKSEDQFFNFGLTYDASTNIKGESTAWLSRRTLGNVVVPGFDSLEVERPGSFSLPTKVGIGLAYEKLLKLTIGVDLTYEKWSNAVDFTGSTDGFRDSFGAALGLEWIPDVNSVDTYFERISYRVGFSYKQSPYLANNSNVDDFGINFGWSLPVGRGSSFDMGFRFGQRGNLNINPIRERYFKALVGVTINDRWFQRRRFD
ncbi:MAG: hypothetical protein RJQ09_08485 [Cyclobacteriaceae bacterium]